MSTVLYEVAQEKLMQAARLLNQHEIDEWWILSRGGTDATFELLTAEKSIHQTICIVARDGQTRLLTSHSDVEKYREGNRFTEVMTYETSLGDALLAQYKRRKPTKIALNISQTDYLFDGLTLGQYFWLQQVIPAAEMAQRQVSSEPVLSELRSVKTRAEISLIRQAINATTDIFAELFQSVKVGMTEIEIGEKFVQLMMARGLTSGLGEPYDAPLVCAVSRGLAHRQPSDYAIRPGDIVIVDASVRCQGYVSDIARTIYFPNVGNGVPDAIQHAFDTAKMAIDAGISALQVGVSGRAVDAIARDVIESRGYPTIRHATGHQIGRECHDGGTVLGPPRGSYKQKVEQRIRANEVYAVEPTVIQDDGRPCMLVEENVLVTPEGPQVLSHRQDKLIVIES